MRRFLVSLLLWTTYAMASGQTLSVPTQAQRLSAVVRPDGGVDAIGVLNGRVWFARTGSGLTFQAPRFLPGPPANVAGPERCPQLAVGADAVRVALWQTEDSLYAARSEDGGDTWTPVTVVDAAATEPDLPAMAANRAGLVVVVWADARDGADSSDVVAENLYGAISHDGGRTFLKPRRITGHHAPAACPCCQPCVRWEGDRIDIAYRSTVKNRKDIQVLSLDADTWQVQDHAVSHQGWAFTGCPHDGPSLSLQPGGAMRVCWTNAERLYWARSADHGLTWSEPEDLGPAAPHVVLQDMICWHPDADHWVIRQGTQQTILPLPSPGAWIDPPGGTAVWVHAAEP